METVCFTPEGCESLSWPIGTPAPFKPSSRHEVIRFDYFNSTHVFLGTDFDVVNKFTGKYDLKTEFTKKVEKTFL